MNPNTNKNVYIKVNPEQMESLTPETVKASVARRAASAGNRMMRRRLLTLCLLAASVVTTLLVGAFADTRKDATQDVPAQVIAYYRQGIGPWDISKEETELVEAAVMAVARGEDSLTMQAVAQALRNTCESTGLSVADAIKEYGYPMFSGSTSDACRKAVAAVVEEGIMAVNDDLRYSYNPAVQDGTWHETMHYVCTIGNLKFYN